MTKPIPDKAEVALEYPDKLYMGTFERTAQFEAHLDKSGVSLTLYRPGDADVRKSVHLHLHHGLFANVLRDLAKTAGAIPTGDTEHREALCAAAGALCCALSNKNDIDDVGGLTPREEVLLLHVLE